ncbi:MAG: hypothetical protein U0531_21390 [Dehalococcoidia bacterium]
MATTYIELRPADVIGNGVRLRHPDWGLAGRPPMVLPHGFSAHAHYWDGFAARCAATTTSMRSISAATVMAIDAHLSSGGDARRLHGLR